MVKNPLANAGEMGSIPDLERTHILGTSKAHAPQLLSLCSRAWETQLVSPHATGPGAHAPQQEKPPQGEARAPQLESSSHTLKRRKTCAAMKTQHSQK